MEAHLRKTRDLENCKAKQKLGGRTELVFCKKLNAASFWFTFHVVCINRSVGKKLKAFNKR